MHTAVSLIAATFLSISQQTFSFLPSSLPTATSMVSSQRRSTKLTMAAAKPDQLPAEAKRYYVRPDRILDVLTSAPQLLLRLGSGALVDGYRCEQTAFPHFLTRQKMTCIPHSQKIQIHTRSSAERVQTETHCSAATFYCTSTYL